MAADVDANQPLWRQAALDARLSSFQSSSNERYELLQRAFSLSRAVDRPADFGSGAFPSEAADEPALAAFIQRYSGGDLSKALPTRLPSLSPTPPSSPASIASDAVVAELISPDLLKERPPVPAVQSAPVEAAPPIQPAAAIFAEPPSPAKSERPKQVEHAVRRSPSLQTGRSPSGPPATPLPMTISPAFINTPLDPKPSAGSSTAIDVEPDAAMAALTANEIWPQLNDFDNYVDTLPPLPPELYRNRMAVGGLHRRKLKEKSGSGQSAYAGGAELFKLGISKSMHMGVRQYMGIGTSDRAAITARTTKVLTSNDWRVGIDEIKMQRVMERLEQVKADGHWSLRQIKKQKGPAVTKAHRDYLLDEMRWLRTDFREERKWKLTTAMAIAHDVAEWHEADDEMRRDLCIKTRPPRYLTDEDMSVDPALSPSPPVPPEPIAPQSSDEPPLASAALSQLPPAAHPTVSDGVTDLVHGLAVSSTEGYRPAPLSFDELARLRAPLFHLPPTTTVVSLDDLPIGAHLAGTNESRSPELLSMLLSEVPGYEGPTLAEGKLDRRYDEATPHHSRLTPMSKLLESKPYLLSTLEPAKKRRRLNEWGDMSHLINEDRKELESKPEQLPIGSLLFAGRKPKEMSHGIIVSQPPPPSNIDLEARINSLDWTPEDDTLLFVLAKQYSYNWHLITEIFNAQVARPPADKRVSWDLWDRWNRKYNASANVNGVVPGAATPSTSNGLGLSSAAEQMSSAVLAAKARDKAKRQSGRFEGPKIGRRSSSLPKAIVQLQRKRELERQRQRSPDKRQTVNLAAHETHNVQMTADRNPFEMSKLKAERDRAEQQRRAQQQAALFQQQQQQQAALVAARYPQLAQQAQQLQQAQASVQQQAAVQQPNGVSTPGPSQNGGTPRLQNAGLPSANGALPARVASPALSAAGSTASPRVPSALLQQPPGTPTGGALGAPPPRPPSAVTHFNDMSLQQQHAALVQLLQNAQRTGNGDTDQARMLADKLRSVAAQLAAAQQQQAATTASANGAGATQENGEA